MSRKLVYILVILLLAGCSGPSVGPKLDKADELMESRPDLALELLEKIDGRRLRGESRARYALLLTQARDRNMIDQTDDSLISIAVDYYDNSDDLHNRMRAHLYQATVYLNARLYESALNDALKAYDYALEINDPANLSLIEIRIAKIFNSTASSKTALDWSLKSIEHAKIAEREQWFADIYGIIGDELFNLQRFSEAVEYLDSADMFSTSPDIYIIFLKVSILSIVISEIMKPQIPFFLI